ncbi:MAG: NifB/NifX family molybdenum-iron cluster-binding protein [bacterium]
MRIAIPFWMERISPVFDVAKDLLLVDIENSTELERQNKRVEEADLTRRAHYVDDLGVKVLICGAISRPLRLILEARGIEVIGQVCGNTEEILQAFLQGSLSDQAFLMPGCKMRRERFHLEAGSLVNGQRWPCMRVAVTSQGPDLTSPVDPRFGHARYLIVFDTETEELTALDNSRKLNSVQGAGVKAVKAVINEGVDAVLTGHVGKKALEALEAARVQVFCGASGTVKDTLSEFTSGQLKPVSNIKWGVRHKGGSDART